MQPTEMFRHLSFPYDGGVFPSQLAAVVQHSVLGGSEPVREVIHWANGDWSLGDGVSDPNVAGAVIATHISHVVTRDKSLAPLAAMPPGHLARRKGPGGDWQIFVHDESDPSEQFIQGDVRQDSL